MEDLNTVMQVLGRIEGKVDEIKDAAKEHRDDDKRRFTEVHARLDEHAEDIAKAKGAKGAIVWIVGLGAGAVSAVVTAALRVKGGG